MAAELVMPTLANEQPHTKNFQPQRVPQRPPHVRSQSHFSSSSRISPLSTSDHSSIHHASTPTSPVASYNARQTRPMYMPAALRPNEFASRPPKSKNNSAENSDTDSDTTLRRASTNIMNMKNLGVFGRRLSRSYTDEQAQELGKGWNLELFPEVTSPPTREHWKVSSLFSPLSPTRTCCPYHHPWLPYLRSLHMSQPSPLPCDSLHARSRHVMQCHVPVIPQE